MKNHWTYFLPEAGAITAMGEKSYNLSCEIERVQKVLESLKQRKEETENQIMTLAKEYWPKREIEKAKSDYITQTT